MEATTMQSLDIPPNESLEMLDSVERQLGFVPNVFASLATSAPALGAFIDLNERFGASSLTPIERETVQLAASVERGSSYCVAGHTRFAHDQQADGRVIEALRNEATVDDTRLDALSQFTRAVIHGDGRVSEAETERFFAAGFGPEQVLDVILGICVKTLSNFTTNALKPSLDTAFSAYAWRRDD